MSEVDPKSMIKANIALMYEILQKPEFRAKVSNTEINDMYDLAREIEDSCKMLEVYENHLALQLIHIHLRELVKRDPTLTNFIVEINLKAPGRTPAMLKLDLYA